MVKEEIDAKPFLVCLIANYQVALPLESVLRVIKYPQPTNSDLEQMGLLQVQNHMVKIIDLYQYIDSEESNSLLKKQPVLVITALAGKLYGIATSEPPTLMSALPDSLKTVPKAAQQPRLLDVVSHAIVITETDRSSTVFLLDMNRVLDAVAQL